MEYKMKEYLEEYCVYLYKSCIEIERLIIGEDVFDDNRHSRFRVIRMDLEYLLNSGFVQYVLTPDSSDLEISNFLENTRRVISGVSNFELFTLDSYKINKRDNLLNDLGI